MKTVKSIAPVLRDGKEWVIRARLADDRKFFEGVDAGYTLAQAHACASASGAPRAHHDTTDLEKDRLPDMRNFGSFEGMPSCWIPLPEGSAVTDHTS